jgi:tetratricopeptide (TPR) repeat protein
MQDTLTAAQAMGVADYSAMLVVRFGEACLLADRLDPALALAEGAFTVAREKAQRSGEAWALHLLGAIASHSDPPDAEKADTHYRQALTLAEELGMRPLIAHCHLGLGKLYRSVGKQPEAQEQLTTATTLYREMDMRFWLEQAAVEMAAL